MPDIVDDPNKWFPVMGTEPHPHSVIARELSSYDCPSFVPMRLMQAHALQAQRNHYQSIETLAERGGCSPAELCAILEDRAFTVMATKDAVADLIGIVTAWQMQEWRKISDAPYDNPQAFRRLYEGHFEP